MARGFFDDGELKEFIVNLMKAGMLTISWEAVTFISN